MHKTRSKVHSILEENIPEENKKHAVLLVHGIRTHAGWFREFRETLEDEGFKVYFANYGKFDLFRFLLPVEYFRNKAKQRVFKQLRDIKVDAPHAQFSIIAHSFGTYVVSRILQDEFDLKLDRIVFINSVIRYDFPFEQFSSRFTSPILNEVGIKDPWPVLAESVTRGYGSTGTFGIKGVRIYDRWHNATHSSLLNAKHCRNFIAPFLKTGKIERNTDPISNYPYFVRMLNSFQIKYVAAPVILLILTFFAFKYKYSVEGERFSISGEEWSVGHVSQQINTEINRPCPLRIIFGKQCNNSLAELITGRTWDKIAFYDHRINDLIFSGSFTVTYKNPVDFWITLAGQYPEKIVLHYGPNGIHIGSKSAQSSGENRNVKCDPPI